MSLHERSRERRTTRFIRTPSDRVSEPHLSESVTAAYLDGALTADERRDAEAHLDACASCRMALADVMRLVDGYDGAPAAADGPTDVAPPVAPRAHTPWARRAVTGGLLAAGIAGVLLATREPGRAVDTAVVRGAAAPTTSESERPIDVVEPPETARAGAGPIVFTWRASSAGFYRVTVLTESGEPVWTLETTDTTTALPASVALVPGRSYFWRVDGIADGIVVSSGARRLRVR